MKTTRDAGDKLVGKRNFSPQLFSFVSFQKKESTINSTLQQKKENDFNESEQLKIDSSNRTFRDNNYDQNIKKLIICDEMKQHLLTAVNNYNWILIDFSCPLIKLNSH